MELSSPTVMAPRDTSVPPARHVESLTRIRFERRTVAQQDEDGEVAAPARCAEEDAGRKRFTSREHKDALYTLAELLALVRLRVARLHCAQSRQRFLGNLYCDDREFRVKMAGALTDLCHVADCLLRLVRERLDITTVEYL